MKWLVLLVLLAALAFVCKPAHKLAPATPQQLATHMLVFGDDDGECTGTAIGPHAILTATHCDEGGKIKKLHIDLSRREYHIKKILTDDRDHDIYLVDGPAFTNLVEYKVRDPRVGEPVFLYGDGEMQYPSRRLDGVVVPFDDPSDVDRDAGQCAFDLDIIPGDSGSAVYGADGQIVAVTTYGWHDGNFDVLNLFSKHKMTAVDYTPAFTDEQIAEAKSFAPSTVPDAPPFPQRTPVDFFSFFSNK